MGDIYTNPPQSRNEAIIRATIDGTEYEAPPQSRMEDLLVELKAAIEQGGGIGNYNDLNNKPKINSVTLQGNKAISDLFDGKVDIGVGTVTESGYAELKDENGDRIFRASSANGEATVASGALIGQPGALELYNGEGGFGLVRPKGGVGGVEVDLPAENGTLALDSQIASSQTPPKASVVTVNDAAPINAEDITVDITPVQLGSGTPSPDNIRPIEGRTGAELDRVGKNKLTHPFAQSFPMTFGGVTITDDDGRLTLNDTCITGFNLILVGNSSTVWGNLDNAKSLPIPDGDYTVSGGDETAKIWINQYRNGDLLNTYGVGAQPIAISVLSTDLFEISVRLVNGTTYSNITISPQIEAGSQPTAYEPYQGQQYTASFGETVYGGKWHVTEGGTDKTYGNIASYNGETINEPWLSSLDEYSPGATPTTGAQVVYPLTTPTTISTPKQNVPMLKGINTVSADCGDTSLKYQPDNVIGELKGEIQELESELDKLDKAYMTSDTFSEMGIDGEYQITRIGNEIHVAAVIDDASIATQTGSVDLIADLPDEFKCNPSYGAVLALRHSSGTGKIEFKLNPGITQSFYIYVEEVNTTSGVWFPIYDVPGKAL